MIEHRKIQRHFQTADPILAKVIKQVGPITLKPRRKGFQTLVQSIISQQISTGAARAIRLRLEKRLEPDGIRPAAMLRLSVEQLREVGLSRPKAGYMLDLAQKCADGTVPLTRLARMTDERVIEQLIQVKGIGRWSAQMFLIFSLGRPDVFPLDDLGIRTAITRLYNFTEAHGKQHYQEVGERWKPYATIGSWYCWRFLDLHRQAKKRSPDSAA